MTTVMTNFDDDYRITRLESEGSLQEQLLLSRLGSHLPEARVPKLLISRWLRDHSPTWRGSRQTWLNPLRSALAIQDA